MTTEAFDEIVDTMSFFDGWEDRYRHVIDLGKALAPLDDHEKTDASKVAGCASQVWLVASLDNDDGKLSLGLRGESDALIVRGLIAILIALYSGQSPEQILKTEAKGELAKLGLEGHLSAQRSNGLASMIARIHALARAASSAG